MTVSAKTKLVAAFLLVIACAFGVSALSRREAATPRAETPRREARAAEPEAAVVPPSPPPVDFAAIDRDRDVHGVVVDGAGNAVANADVRVVRYRGIGIAFGLAQLEAEEGPGTRTATDGSFALRVERGEEVDLRVKADGFVELQRRWCPAGGKVRIVMRRGVSLRVRAIGPGGKPLAGVHVVAFKGKEAEMEAAGIYVYLQGVTDGQGVSVLPDLLPGREIQLMAWHPDFDFAKPGSAKLPETGEAEVQLTAERGREVSGRVTDAATGAPVADAVVTPYPIVLPFAKSVRTDADGKYRYGWGSGERVLFVHADGFASAQRPVVELDQIDFALRRGGTVTGVVRDPAGAPVAGAFVSALDSDRTAIRETWSDASGRFELRDVGPGSQVLIAAKPGFGRAQKPLDAPEMEIVLAEPRRLEGRVLGPGGEPLQALVRVGSSSLEAAEQYERHTDDLGRFRFTDLRSGRWAVSVTASDERRTGREVKIEDVDVFDFDFQYERGREYTVLVVDETRRPLPGVPLASNSGRKTTGPDGRATFELPKGLDIDQVYVSKVEARFVRPAAANYRLGQGDLTIVLRDAVTLSGRVLLDGDPIVAAVLMLTGPDGFHDATGTDKEGKFTRSIPARAEVKVALNGQFGKLKASGEWETETLPIYGEETVAPGATEVVVRARRVPLDRTLVVRVTGPDGTGVEGIGLSVQARGYRSEKPLVTDARGRLELSLLPAGEMSVSMGLNPAPAPWAAPKTTSAQLVPEGQEVVFAFREATPIKGVVLMPDGSPAKANVTAWSEQGRAAFAKVAEDGTFAIYIAADEPEPVRIGAYEASGKGHVELAGVVPGTEGITIRLPAE